MSAAGSLAQLLLEEDGVLAPVHALHGHIEHRAVDVDELVVQVYQTKHLKLHH